MVTLFTLRTHEIQSKDGVILPISWSAAGRAGQVWPVIPLRHFRPVGRHADYTRCGQYVMQISGSRRRDYCDILLYFDVIDAVF